MNETKLYNIMQNFSTTQATNIASLVGVAMIILNYFKINITSEELQTFLGAGIALVGVISNFVHRYQQGDLTLGGFRK